jgi:hypothetical protein
MLFGCWLEPTHFAVWPHEELFAAGGGLYNQHDYKLNGNKLALPEPRFFSSGIQFVCV